MDDNSTKSLMVDERQLARDVLDNLFEKTHCDCNVDWCLYEIYPELQIERIFEDHENVVEILSDWTRDTENKVLFLEKEEKYAVFKNPQVRCPMSHETVFVTCIPVKPQSREISQSAPFK
ncbi:hypothetical protein U0070_025346 [Myodes glareolus]|uniref:Ras-associating domain-containing protein n=1 Tax=Myodes glareolus TaxID=447135 RepID=A0AAW0JN03_MYOGA